MNLHDLGWTPQRASALLCSASPSATPGRVVRLDGAQATIWSANGPQRVNLPSRLRRDHALVVGDWVTLALDPGDPPRIDQRLPRTTHLARRAAGRRVRRQLLAANVDVVFILSSMDTDFSERRLERYLTVTHDGGARPVILLTKAGLVDDPEPWVARAKAVAPGIDVHDIDVVAGHGGEVPGQYLAPGTTAVLVGSSGVGKSTLLNHLAGRSQMATGPVRNSDGLGQHTTTHRELFALPGGGVVIDTPGIRELALWADEESLGQAFADLDALAKRCRFGDCTHQHEPGCAVQEAIEQGRLEPGRLRGYLDLRQEIERTTVEVPAYERRRKARRQGRMYRQAQAHKRRRR